MQISITPSLKPFSWQLTRPPGALLRPAVHAFMFICFYSGPLEMWLSITTGTISVFPGSFIYSDMFKGWKADFDFMD